MFKEAGNGEQMSLYTIYYSSTANFIFLRMI